MSGYKAYAYNQAYGGDYGSAMDVSNLRREWNTWAFADEIEKFSPEQRARLYSSLGLRSEGEAKQAIQDKINQGDDPFAQGSNRLTFQHLGLTPEQFDWENSGAVAQRDAKNAWRKTRSGGDPSSYYDKKWGAYVPPPQAIKGTPVNKGTPANNGYPTASTTPVKPPSRRATPYHNPVALGLNPADTGTGSPGQDFSTLEGGEPPTDTVGSAFSNLSGASIAQRVKGRATRQRRGYSSPVTRTPTPGLAFAAMPPVT